MQGKHKLACFCAVVWLLCSGVIRQHVVVPIYVAVLQKGDTI